MITEFVPGAYMVHDQLHVRGGHQVTWAIDGVPIPNTNIASNVGPQFNPKDVDYLEAQTGSYAAEYGDRTYGVFNVAPRNGFERDRQAELIASYGNYNQTDDLLSFGDHSEKFAYYASVSGNRSEYGLEPPTDVEPAQPGERRRRLHLAHLQPQCHRPASLRRRRCGSITTRCPTIPSMQAAGIDDREREQDIFGTLTWVHTYSPGLMLTLSPFYHFNRAAYKGGPTDVPSATDNRALELRRRSGHRCRAVKGRHNARVGIYAFAQQDNSYFSRDCQRWLGRCSSASA